MTSTFHLTSRVAFRISAAGMIVLGSTSLAWAQQPATYMIVPTQAPAAVAYTTPAPVYQTAANSYAPQYYQMSYAPQYYQPAAAPTVDYNTVAYAPQAVQPAAYNTVAYAPQAVQPAAEPASASYTQAEAAEQPAASGGDPYGFLSWLNSTRAAYGLGAVGYDPNLESWASVNNGQQNSLGMGHHVMGPARRQNSAMGSYPGITSMWMASPAHRAALLDPTIQWIGIAGMGAYWTFNAY